MEIERSLPNLGILHHIQAVIEMMENNHTTLLVFVVGILMSQWK